MVFTYLCFDIESVLALVAEEDENAQRLSNLGDALKGPGLQYYIYMYVYDIIYLIFDIKTKFEVFNLCNPLKGLGLQ